MHKKQIANTAKAIKKMQLFFTPDCISSEYSIITFSKLYTMVEKENILPTILLIKTSTSSNNE